MTARLGLHRPAGFCFHWKCFRLLSDETTSKIPKHPLLKEFSSWSNEATNKILQDLSFVATFHKQVKYKVSISKSATLCISLTARCLKQRGQNTSLVTFRKVSPERLLSVWQQSIVWLTFRSCTGTVSPFCQLGWWQRARDNKFWQCRASTPVGHASDLLVPQYSEVSC